MDRERSSRDVKVTPLKLKAGFGIKKRLHKQLCDVLIEEGLRV